MKNKMGLGIIGVGVVGTGRFGKFLIESYEELPSIEIKGICSTTTEKLKSLSKKYSIPFYSTNYKDLIARKDVDIVVIATPPYLHAKMSIDAIKSGKHVLCEKPPAIKLKDMEKIKQFIKKKQVKYKVDFVLRENPLIKKLKQIIKSNVFGDIQNIEFNNFASDSTLEPTHWFWDKSKSGGIWVEHGVHFFDLFNFLLGKRVNKIFSVSNERREGMEDQVSCIADYNSVMASFAHSFTKPSQIEETYFAISFKQGNIHVRGWIPLEMEIEGIVNNKQYEKLKEIVKIEKTKKLKRELKKRGKAISASKRIKTKLKLENKKYVYKDSIKNVMKNLVEAIKGREKLDFGFEESYKALKDSVEAEKNNIYSKK